MILPNPYIIAEIGVNHGGDLELAKTMIADIAASGGHAAKFQTYKADLIAAKDSPAYWDQSKEPTETQHKLFQKFDSFCENDYKILAEECRKYNIDFLSTPFDVECLEWLMPLMQVVKIASADLTNDILLEAVAAYKKPVILSVGASSDDEIAYAVNLLESAGAVDITLLHCMLLYPTPLEHGFLSRITSLRARFHAKQIKIGYSDHIPPSAANNDQLLIARAMGCCVIEKHFTHDKTLPGNDHYHAIDKEDLSALINRLRVCDLMISSEDDFINGGLSLQISAVENARRSLYFRRDLYKGEQLKSSDVIAKRPGKGISPKHYKELVGRTLSRDVSAEDIIRFGDFI